MEIKIKKLRDFARIPERGTAGAAGADLYSASEGPVAVRPHETVMIPTGIAVELPEMYAGLVFARSGLASKRGLAPANKVGLIDPDYRGEIMVALHNHGETEETVLPGERIAQFVVVPYVAADFVEADCLSETKRGDGGFGSTGTH